MLRPKYVPPLLLFVLQCLHFPSSLVNFVLIPANPRPHEGVRFLLEKSIISISAIDKLQSIREIFVGFLVSEVSNQSRNVFIREISKTKLTRYFQNFLDGQPTVHLDLYCCVLATP